MTADVKFDQCREFLTLFEQHFHFLFADHGFETSYIVEGMAIGPSCVFGFDSPTFRIAAFYAWRERMVFVGHREAVFAQAAQDGGASHWKNLVALLGELREAPGTSDDHSFSKDWFFLPLPEYLAQLGHEMERNLAAIQRYCMEELHGLQNM